MASYKEQIPLVNVLICYILGIIIATSLNIFSIIHYGLLFVILGILLFGFRKFTNYSFNNRQFYIGAIVAILFILISAINTKQNISINDNNHFSKVNSKFLIANVIEVPSRKNDIERFLVKVNAVINDQKITPTTGYLLLALKSEQPTNFKYGEKLIIKTKYYEIDPPFNRGEFNFKKYMWYKNVYHQTFINAHEISSVGIDNSNLLKQLATKFCLNQVAKFKKYIKNQEAYAVASILILGYRSDLSADILQTYSNTGTIHILSVSGMHVAIIAAFLEYILFFLNRNKKLKILKTLLIITIVWFYALVAGLQPSVERSAIMISFFLIGKLIFHRVNTYNIIALSALIILLHQPFALFDVGFQLSYIAVVGLIYLQPKIYIQLIFDNPLLDIIWKCFSVSLAAQIVTAPLSIYYFHQFPMYFLISNLFIALPAVFIMLLGVVIIAIPWSVFFMQIISKLLEKLILFTNDSLRWLENLPFATMQQLHINFIEVIVFYIFIFALVVAIKNRDKYKLYMAIVSFSLLVISATIFNIEVLNQKKIVFFSLRKNAAVAYIHGKQALILTDLLKSDKAYQFSVKPNLDLHKITSVKIVNPYIQPTNVKYQFNNTSVFINNFKYPNLMVDYNFLLINNKKSILINKCIQPKLERVFVLGTNPDYLIKNLKQQLDHYPFYYSILKKSPGLEFELQ